MIEREWPQQVLLTPAEVAFALAIAMQRNACKKNKNGGVYSNQTASTGFRAHFNGAIGELCVHKVYGGKFRQDILVDGDKHSYDVMTSDQKAVEVKTSLYNGADPHIKMETNEMGKFQWLCLVHIVGSPDLANVYPLISQKQFEKIMIKQNYGYGERLSAKASDILACVEEGEES